MKKLLMLCLVGMAAVAMAAEMPIELKTKKDIFFWGGKKYYETVNVSVENGAAKVAVEKTVPDAKPIGYSFGVQSKQTLKAGKTYTLSFTLKSNMDVRVWCSVSAKQQGKYAVIGGQSVRAEVIADKPTLVELQVTPKEDAEGMIRLPSMYGPALQEGQTLEISNVKLSDEPAPVPAAAVPVEIKTQKDLVWWGDKKCYETVNVTAEDGVAKVAVEKTVPDAKLTGYMLSIRNKKAFKAGKLYTLTFTVKSNKDAKVSYAVQLLSKPYTYITNYVSADLTADTPRTFTLRFVPQADVEGTTRVPSLGIPLKEGQTLELSNVKLAEEDAAK